MPTAELTIKALMDVREAETGFDRVADSSTRMSSAVDDASKKAQGATDRINRAADATDALDSKSSQATGALGALASGFELVGLDKYAAGLQSAALATDFLSGVGAAGNLVTNAGSLATARATIATKASTVATKTSAIATKTFTAGQWLLNAALTANPIGLVVLAAAALTAGLILAYKKSETFRSGVNAIRDKAIDLKDKFVDVAQTIPEKIGDAKDKVVGFFRDMIDPVQDLIDKIGDLIGKIKNVSLPRIDLNPFNGRSTVSGRSLTETSTGQSMTIYVQGAIDPYSTAKQIQQLLNQYGYAPRLSVFPVA